MSQVAGSRQGHRVVVLSNHALTRAGLAQLLAQENVTLSVVESPRRVAQVGRHEVVLYDLADESGNSLDDLALVLAEGAPIVALTSPGRSHLAETILAMGVSETVQMDVRADGLVQALGRVAAGQTTSLEAHRRRRRDAARVGTELTDREVSVLELIGAGLSNQEIARRSCGRPGTPSSEARGNDTRHADPSPWLGSPARRTRSAAVLVVGWVNREARR
jgi:DNA-binding NarL/FixJ family response regulator